MHRGTIRPLAIAVLALVAAGASLALAVQARTPKGTDLDQIRAVIQQGERAVEDRGLGATLAVISGDYRDDNGFTRDALRPLIGRGYRDMQEIDVHIPERSLQIQLAANGHEAAVSMPVYLLFTRRGGGALPRDLQMSLQLRKEPSRIFGVFPSHAWRIVRADGYGGVSDILE